MHPTLNSDRLSASRSMFHIIILLIIFTPGHLLEWGVERALVAITSILSIYYIAKFTHPGQEAFFSTKTLFIYFSTVQLFYAISFLIGVGGATASQAATRDYYEMLRFMIYFLYAALIFRAFRHENVPPFTKIIYATIGFSAIVAAIYIVRVPYISGFLEGVIYADTRDNLSDLLTGGRTRFTAPFPNANYLAYFLCMAITYLLFYVSSSPRYLISILAIGLLYLTGSRTGWIVGGIVLTVWGFAHLLQSLKSPKFSSVLAQIIFASIFLVLISFLFEYFATSTRVSELSKAINSRDLFLVDSFSHRVNEYFYLLTYVSKSLLFGWGPSKENIGYIIDNQYLLWILRHGFLGFFLIIFGAVALFFKMWKSAKGDLVGKFGIVAFAIVVALFLLTGAFLNNFRLFFITVLFAAAMIASKQRVRSNEGVHHRYAS